MLNQDVEVKDLLVQVQSSQEAMATWSDERRKDFVATFNDRLTAARFILDATAENVAEKAWSRKYLSQKHIAEKYGAKATSKFEAFETLYGRRGSGRYSELAESRIVGGRSSEDLISIARDRASQILEELPPIKNAVKVISPETAAMMDKRDKLLKKLEELQPKLEELSVSMKLSDYDELKVKDFRALVAKREKDRTNILKQCDELGKEGCKLEDEINKRLYAGLPGITEAVLKVVEDLEERSDGMEAFGRRMKELVMFGDSKAAMEVLSQFEKDEVAIDKNIKAEFDNALKKLKLAAASGKIPKELAGGSKK